MKKTVTVALTILEARALSHAAGEATMAPDIMEALFPSIPERVAARRAQQKLDRAIWAAARKDA